MEGRGMKKLNLITIILFIVILLIPIVTFNFQPNQSSVIDNRKLTEFPSLSKETGITQLIKDMNSYFTDRIGCRSLMITSCVLIQEKLFGVLAHPIYAKGKDGYVFFKLVPQLTDYEYVNEFSEFVAKLQTYCKERGVGFLFSLEPNKQIVYQQYLPEGVNYKNDRVPLMLKNLTEKNINHIYTAPALINASKNTQVYNVKYDAGHWNDNGAFVGISQMLQTLQQDYPSLSLPEKFDYNISYELHTSLPVSYYPIYEEVPVYALKDSQITSVDTYKNEIKTNNTGWYYSYYQNPSKPTAPKILVFMGSYFEYKEKFIAESFSETMFVHSYLNIQDFDYYFNIFQPDVVLFQTADYATTDTYYPLDIIKNINYNPSYSTFQNLPVTDFAYLSNNIGQELKDAALSSKTQLTNFTFPVSGKKIAYAYAKIDGKTYDFRVTSSDGKQIISITMDKKVVLTAKEAQVIIISTDTKQQNVIPIKIEEQGTKEGTKGQGY